MLTIYRSREPLPMVGSKWLFESRHLERVLKILLRYSQMELLNSVLAWSLVSEYNLWTSTKRDLYQRVQRVPTRLLVLVQHVPARILVLVQHVPTRILVLVPSVYITVSDHTRIIRRYHIHGNPVRISILLGITRTSLNNVKVRCVGQDEFMYNSYVRNTTPTPHRNLPLRLTM